MSAFNLAHESADAENQNPEAGVETPESETATAAVSEATAAEQEVAQEDDTAEQLDGEQEELEDIQEEVAKESDGLSPVTARLLSQSLSRIVGKQHAKKVFAMENYQSSRSGQREAKAIALEGIKETLKQFWEAIKAQLKKFYNKVKTYFVKAFSAARKLKDRAEKLQTKANDTIGTIEDKSFSFGQTKAIAVDGKYNDINTVTAGLNGVRKWIEANLTVQKSDKYEGAVEKLQVAVEKAVKDILTDTKSNGGNSHYNAGFGVSDVKSALSDLGSISIAPYSSVGSPDSKLVEMYAGGKGSKDKVIISTSLPGGKAMIYVEPDGGSATGLEGVSEVAKVVKNTRIVLGNDRFNPRDVTEGDVKTLTTSQVDKVCDDVIEIAESAYTYEKAWERRDKFQAKIEREIDAIVKDANSDDDENNARTGRIIREYANSFTASVRRRTSFESQFIGYALNTGSAFLNYAERSLAQHKSK